MTSNASCRHCGRAEPTVVCVQLWDNLLYCRGCVDNACRGLFEFAQGNQSLVELVDTATLGSLRQPIGWWIRMTITPALLVAIGIGMAFDGMKVPGMVACALGVCSCVVKGHFLWKARHVVRPDASEPLRISARNGCIEVCRGERPLVCAPLTGWRWWHVVGGTKSLSQRVPIERLVVLEPPRSAIDAQYVCGSTPEMRARWIGFLKLANVPRIRSGFW